MDIKEMLKQRIEHDAFVITKIEATVMLKRFTELENSVTICERQRADLSVSYTKAMDEIVVLEKRTAASVPPSTPIPEDGDNDATFDGERERFIAWSQVFHRNAKSYTGRDFDHGLVAWRAALQSQKVVTFAQLPDQKLKDILGNYGFGLLTYGDNFETIKKIAADILSVQSQPASKGDAEEFLRKIAYKPTMVIISTNELTELAIAEARACGRMLVLDGGLGFAIVPLKLDLGPMRKPESPSKPQLSDAIQIGIDATPQGGHLVIIQEHGDVKTVILSETFGLGETSSHAILQSSERDKDGEALRLAAELEINVGISGANAVANWWVRPAMIEQASEVVLVGDDKCATLRLAIQKAADTIAASATTKGGV